MKRGREAPPETKMKQVEELSRLVAEHPVVGVINLAKLPAACLQRVKHELHGKAVIKVAKNTVLKRALEASDKKALLDSFVNQPALLFTKENPFKIYKLIEKSKSKVSAKPGDKAADDIIVSAGPTDLPPGPAISTLSQAKIPAKVEGGKIAVIKDVTVVKRGEAITPALASILNMLKLKPMEVMADVVAMWEGGTIYLKEVLAVDEAKTLADMTMCSQRAFGLAVHVGWTTKETIRPLIVKAFMNAKTLGLEAGILDKGVIDDLLAKAKRQADALSALVPAPAEAQKQ